MQGIFGFCQTETLFINPEASKVTFTIKHMGVLNVEGIFKEFQGQIRFNKKKLSHIESSIKVASINTDDQGRDRTIISEDYLNAESFPLISFVSETINEQDITGTLKIKNVEKRITIPYVIDKNGVINISTTLSREQFELDFGSMNSLIGNTIKVQLILKTK